MARHVSLTALVAAATVGVLAIALGGAACSSLPDLAFDDADGSGGDAGPCVKTGPEACDDGIDNDCNGKTDCADDACDAKYRCVAGAPDDWQLTALVQGSRPGCPDGFGDSSDVKTVSGNAGSPTCGCDCGGASACNPSGIVVGIATTRAAATTTRRSTRPRAAGASTAMGCRSARTPS